MTFENDVGCVQTPKAFLKKELLASFCLRYTSFDFFSIVPASFVSLSFVVLNL